MLNNRTLVFADEESIDENFQIFKFVQQSSSKRTFVSEDNILEKTSQEDVVCDNEQNYLHDNKTEYTSDQMAVSISIF